MDKLLKIALSQYGIKEWPGEASNPEITKYFETLGTEYDEVYAWCSAFINWCCMGAGMKYTGRLNARSWLKWGKPVHMPEPGDIIVLWRDDPASWKGHVGLYINERSSYYNVLGGNQNNMVCIKEYPKHRLLGIRRYGGKTKEK